MKVERSGAAFLFGRDRNLPPDFEIRPSMDAMQPGALERMERALAIYPIIVWRILHLVARGRDCPNSPCGAALDPRNGGPPGSWPGAASLPGTAVSGGDGALDRRLRQLLGSQKRGPSRP
ncbi:MAG TPA: hypothetical protein PK256_25590 [Verrucomicrobiota bacterium]|nr:hypothetical protein [Verrucomicrobiota bacterium]